MNPLAYLVAALLILAAGFGSGFHVGTNKQKVADQTQFDKIDKGITEQKAVANAAYRAFQEHNLALLVERDQLKTALEIEHETDRIATAAQRDKYSALSLRFSASVGAGFGGSGCSAPGAGADSTGNAVAAVVQLPDALAADLRRLAFDADELADNYRECYGYARRVR